MRRTSKFVLSGIVTSLVLLTGIATPSFAQDIPTDWWNESQGTARVQVRTGANTTPTTVFQTSNGLMQDMQSAWNLHQTNIENSIRSYIRNTNIPNFYIRSFTVTASLTDPMLIRFAGQSTVLYHWFNVSLRMAIVPLNATNVTPSSYLTVNMPCGVVTTMDRANAQGTFQVRTVDMYMPSTTTPDTAAIARSPLLAAAWDYFGGSRLATFRTGVRNAILNNVVYAAGRLTTSPSFTSLNSYITTYIQQGYRLNLQMNPYLYQGRRKVIFNLLFTR